MADSSQENIKNEFNTASSGLNMDQSANQIKKGQLSYALNASLENFDANSVSYQNEPGNVFCLVFPEGYVNLGNHYIQEKNKHLFFLKNPVTEESEIGYMDNNDCVYRKLVNHPCLNFDINFPIHKVVHKISNCSIEIFWPDNNGRRYLDIENIPRKLISGSTLCDPIYSDELDCNQLRVQPNFKIPSLKVVDVQNGGDNTAGTVQFAIQYADSSSNPFTSYYSITNPTPIADLQITTPNFNYQVGKSPVVEISNLDDTGQFEYFNLAVIKKINNIESVELVGTYFIDATTKRITYTGQNVTQIRLTIFDIFEKFPYYELADDITAVQDVLVWKGLTSVDRVNYQSIASKIHLMWETYRIPSGENYSNELNATNLRQYLRDEVYAFEFVPLLRSGKQADGFHIPGKQKEAYDYSFPDIPETDPDFIGTPMYYSDDIGYSPYWKIYNTARVIDASNSPNIGNATSYQFGEFGYHESSELYPCNSELWGELAGTPIRHHRMPDVEICPIIEKKPLTYNPSGFAPVMENVDVFALGVRIDVQQIKQLIADSDLTQEQKDDIIGFKIIRGDRGTNKSIVGKGILRNIGSYEREQQTYYFPNYPYNDLSSDPFINSINNAFAGVSEPWLVICSESGEYEYGDPNTNKAATKSMEAGQTYEFWSTFRPVYKSGKALIGPANYDVWYATGCFGSRGYRVNWQDPFTDDNSIFVQNSPYLNGGTAVLNGGCDSVFGRVEVDGTMGHECNNPVEVIWKCEPVLFVVDSFEQPLGVVWPLNEGGRRSTLKQLEDNPLPPIVENGLGHRQIFNSPETSFGQPFLGNVLKLESLIFGGGKAHFVEVQKNAKYKLLSKEAQEDALKSADSIGRITDPFNATAMFTAYQAYLTIYLNGITRKNYAYSFNSISDYNYYENVPSLQGIKQRQLDLKQYLIPGVQSVGDDRNINNYQRESSVYLRTDLDKPALPYPPDSPNMQFLNIRDKSRFTIGEVGACSTPGEKRDITVLSYYASLKNTFDGQWGQIYSYDTVDTGFQVIFGQNDSSNVIFGGDTFISRFTFKTKLPFFIDNRVGANDDSDIFYDEIGNIGYPKYWHSARAILENYALSTGQVLSNFISYKAHSFDCPNDPSEILPSEGNFSYSSYRTYYDGYFYLFAYGVPNFYCETSYNLDLRQAFNNKEGDFWPHVSTDIPDDWVQESFVSIANDNTYNYNVTFSTQNKENTFTHLPQDWDKVCYTNYPFRAIYSDPQQTDADNRVNNWLIYRSTSYFDFPQNYGGLTSLDGIQNKAVLARFENKSLLYNNLLTMDTSNPQAAYLGNPTLFKGAPPIDFAETDLGHVGSQNKFLLKIPQGQITIDAKRGQIFLISGTQAVDLTAFGSGVNRFMTDNLSFKILNTFPDVPTDNHFNGIGLHGVYDSKYDRIIITKLDYIPLSNDIKYDATLNQFYIETLIGNKIVKTEIYLSDNDYFCNKSFTISFNFNTKSWISFHSYIPNWYIGENNFFYSGLNGCCTDLDGEFSLLIGEDIPPPPPTTDTTTFPPPPTTTSTTTEVINCELEGEAIQVVCDLAGTAIVTIPPIPTTTICVRPSNLPLFIFITGYIAQGLETDSTIDQLSACSAITVIRPGSEEVTVLGISVYSEYLEIGQIVYNNDIETMSCDVIPDGWYITEQGMVEGFVYHVVDGIIVSIDNCECSTTTTTSAAPLYIPNCCSSIISDEDELYYNNLVNGELTRIVMEGYTVSLGTAVTENYFWSVTATEFNQWDITTDPFTSIFNTQIAFPGTFTTSSGITAIDDLNLIAVDDSVSPQEVVELFIDTLVSPIVFIPTIMFALQVNRMAKGNPLYTTSKKLIIINEDSVTNNYYITQYDYLTGTIELDINIGTMIITSIYECNCSIYAVKQDGELYTIEKTFPHLLIESSFISLNSILSITQISQCVNSSLIEEEVITTTSTTTL